LAGNVTAGGGADVTLTTGVVGAGATGSITRTGGTVTGDQVTMTARDSIGAAATPILTVANTLRASTSLNTAAGGINVSNAGSVNVTANGAISLNGAGGALSTLLSVSGAVASGGNLTIDTQGTGSNVYSFGGAMSSGGNTFIDTNGPANVTLAGTGSITSN